MADESWWQPGLVVVEFLNPVEPEWFAEANRAGRPEPNAPWLDVFTVWDVLDEHGLAHDPEWTFDYDASGLSPDSDRARFINFRFRPDEDVVSISALMRGMRGVVFAAPEPLLAAPDELLDISQPDDLPLVGSRPNETPLLNEPLATSGGDPNGKAVVNPATQLQNQWYLFRCEADDVLTGRAGRGVVVADIDWGFRVSHQDLTGGRIKFSLNVKENNNDVTRGPRVEHGTAVLGLLGGDDNNAGMLGFAYEAELWAIQADNGKGSFDSGLWARAIKIVSDRPSNGKPKVILVEASSNRGGNVEMSSRVRKEIIDAISGGAIVCVAAGSAGLNADDDHSGVNIPPTGSILIGATKYTANTGLHQRGASNWTRGDRIVVSAPGGINHDVTCCNCADDRYRNDFGGSSGAAPKVAGTIALMLEENPALNHAQVREILRRTGRQISVTDGKLIGTFLNTKEAVAEAARAGGRMRQMFRRIGDFFGGLFGRGGD